MNRFRSYLPLVAVLAVAAVLGVPSQARATFIYLQEAGINGGNITQVGTSSAGFTSETFTGSYGDFTVTIFGGSSDNDATLSDILSSTVNVKNNSGTAQTLKLWISQNNFSLPAGTPLRVESGLGGTVNSGTVVLTSIFQAYADKGNNLLANGTLTGGAAITDFTNGPQTASLNGTTLDTGSASGTFNRTGLYSLTSVVTFTLSAGGSANFGTHVNVTHMPEPASALLLVAGLPFLGLGGYLRRRKAAQAAQAA